MARRRIVPPQSRSSLFNNETDSDLKLVFPASNRTLHVHRLILGSEFFRSEMREPRYTMHQDDDEDLMTDIIKSAYTLEIELSRGASQIVPMIRLAKKYKFDSLVETLTADLKESPNELLKGDTYLGLSLQDMESLLNIVVDLNTECDAYRAVQAWVASDVSQREAHSYRLTSLVTQVAQRPMPYINTHFDPDFCSPSCALFNDGKIIQKMAPETNWHCAALGTKPNCTEYSIRLIQDCMHVMVGMAPKSLFSKKHCNYSQCGFYLYTLNGTLYSQRSEANTSYANRACHENGTVITVKYQNGEMRYAINGEDKGVAYKGLSGDLYPAFGLYSRGAKFEFV